MYERKEKAFTHLVLADRVKGTKSREHPYKLFSSIAH